MKKRVVITGMGAVSPVGNTAEECWVSVLEGKSGISNITKFTAEDIPVKIAGEVKNFDASQFIHPKEIRKMDDFIIYGLSSGLLAWKDAGFDKDNHNIDPTRIGVLIGSGIGGIIGIQKTALNYKEGGYKKISPFFIPSTIPNLASGQLSIAINAKGPNLCIATACAAGSHSIGESMRMIQRGDVDLMLAGGSDGILCPIGVGGFAIMKALSTHNDEPTKASRPFDTGRDGFIASEGAAVLVLEEYEHAKKRGAKMYAEVIGYGATGDAYHITSPAEDSDGAIRCMEAAIKDAGINRDLIDYVNAHGTSTPMGDVLEANAIAKTFGEHSKKLNVSSTKSCTGHMLGAAGAIETIFTALAVMNDVIPPTINLENVDPKIAELGLNLTPNFAQKRKVNYALNNSFGFGGTNSCLILKKCN